MNFRQKGFFLGEKIQKMKIRIEISFEKIEKKNKLF